MKSCRKFRNKGCTITNTKEISRLVLISSDSDWSGQKTLPAAAFVLRGRFLSGEALSVNVCSLSFIALSYSFSLIGDELVICALFRCGFLAALNRLFHRRFGGLTYA